MQLQTLDQLDLDAFSMALDAESDRACAVLGAALLDAKLEEIFRRRLKSDHKELLPSGRALGSFSVKIRLACALGWISDDVRHDFDIIREVRNRFAHSFDHNLAFSDQSVCDRCENLLVPQALMDGMDEAARTVANTSPQVIYAMRDVHKPARRRFELSVAFLSQHLDDLDASTFSYQGPDILAQSRALGARTRLVVRATATISSPPLVQES